MMCMAVFAIACTSCMDGDEATRKIRSLTEKVREMKAEKGIVSEEDSEEIADGSSEEVKGPRWSVTRRKALNKDEAWYMRDFRMELDVKALGVQAQDLLQKSGNVFYLRRIAGSNQVESLFLIKDDKVERYLINPRTKQAQLQKIYEGDFGVAFRDGYAREMGLLVEEGKSQEKKEKDSGFISSKTTEEISVEDARLNGFDCEKTTIVVHTQSEASPAMEVLDGIFGTAMSKTIQQTADQLGNTVQTTSVWVDKKSGAVIKREYKMEGATSVMNQMAGQQVFQPTVKSLIFNPDPSLIPRSLDGYTLVN